MTIPLPPAESGQPRRGRHASRKSAAPLGITRIMQSSELPAGINAFASADGKTVIVRAGLDKVSRRRAVREVLAATHRFPSLVLIPALINSRIRRFLFDLAEAVTTTMQHAVTLLTPSNPIVAAVATVTVLAAGTGIGIVTGVITPPSFTNGASGDTPGLGPNVPNQDRLKPIHKTLKPLPAYYLGAYESTSPNSYIGMSDFGALVGHNPNLALYYSGWGEPLRTDFASLARANGATPVVQINPDKQTNIAGIGTGQYDAFLIKYALEVHAYGGPVVIGFGHEMNGNWYRWGWQHASPQVFVAAWRRIVKIFRQVGDYNVTWLWTINGDATGSTTDIGNWWPGAGYVTWVGIDSYYYGVSETFTQVFGSTLADVNNVAPGFPVLISETAADPPEAPEAQQITGLFRGIQDHSILGFIWYDEPGRDGQQWRLEGNAPATTAFQRSVKGYGK
jgi:mannan endo-1,4-beta-mannosidase